jgi:ATP-dependent RNA helicase DeaD
MRAHAPQDSAPPVEKHPRRAQSEAHEDREEPPARRRERPAHGMETYRIEVGHVHGVKPANIVGAIANEAGLEAKYIGRIDIHDDYSLLDLPEGMPKELFHQLKTVWVSGQQLRISHASRNPQEASDFTAGKAAADSHGKRGGKAQTDTRPGPAKRMTDTAKAKPKAHRKGPKPA